MCCSIAWESLKKIEFHHKESFARVKGRASSKLVNSTATGNDPYTTMDQNVSKKTRTADSTGTGNGTYMMNKNAERADRARRRSERLNGVRGGESTNITTYPAQRRDYSLDDAAGSDAAYSPSRSGSESEALKARSTKRRRKNYVAPPASPTPPSPASPPPTISPAPPSTSAPASAQLALSALPTSTNLNKVAFAFSSSDVIYHLPIDECTSSRYLFGRARDFLWTLGQELATRFLICQVPSEGKRRMLYEGDEIGFKWLLNDVASLHSKNLRLRRDNRIARCWSNRDAQFG